MSAMPSTTTFERWAITHRRGHKYYHKLADLMCNRRGTSDECEKLAATYLSSLEDLDEYLSTLERSDDVEGIRISTKAHIADIQKDLTKFAKQD